MEEFVGFDTKLPDTLIPLGSISRVIMVTWLTPHSFHVQLKSFAEECDEMMMRLQDFYQKRPHIVSQVPNDAIVIGRQKSDNAFKRVKIIDYNAALKKYRTQSIDYGNKFICVQNDLFQLEKSFTKLPPLAICCNLIDIIRNRSREEISHLIDKYLDKTKSMSCEFIETKNDVTSVKFSIAGVDLKTAMINDGLLSELPSGSLIEFQINSERRTIGMIFFSHNFRCRYLPFTSRRSNDFCEADGHQRPVMLPRTNIWL